MSQAILYHTFNRSPLPLVSETNKIVEDAIIHFAMEQVTISPPYIGLPQETELSLSSHPQPQHT